MSIARRRKVKETEQEQLTRIYREIIPPSSYDECEGCHHGSDRCALVHILYKQCPCDKCLVKTSCTNYCSTFLLKLVNIAGESEDKFHITHVSPYAYHVVITGRAKRRLNSSNKSTISFTIRNMIKPINFTL